MHTPNTFLDPKSKTKAIPFVADDAIVFDAHDDIVTAVAVVVYAVDAVVAAVAVAVDAVDAAVAVDFDAIGAVVTVDAAVAVDAAVVVPDHHQASFDFSKIKRMIPTKEHLNFCPRGFSVEALLFPLWGAHLIGNSAIPYLWACL